MGERVEAVVRLSRTMPRDDYPGVGLHCYHYANNSRRRSLIVTKGMDSPMWPVREDAIVAELFYRDMAATRENVSFFDVLKIGATKLRGEYKIFAGALALIRKHRIKPSIIHVHSANYLMAGVLLKLLTGAPLCLNFGGTELVRAKRLLHYRVLFRFLDAGFYVSRAMEKSLHNYLPKSRCIYTANGMDDRLFYVQKDVQKQDVITAVGNLRWQKDYPNLFRAFRIVHEARPSYRLRIFGDGPLKSELVALRDSLGLSEVIVFEGMKHPDEVRVAHNSARLFVLSSKSEGFPKAQIEAMACGLPVVVTDTGSCKEVARNAGCVVPVGDHQQLAEKILYMLDHPVAMQACAQEAETASAQYSWASVCRVVDECYDRLEKK